MRAAPAAAPQHARRQGGEAVAAPRVTRRARAAATATCRPISARRQSDRGRRFCTPGTAARSRRVVVRCTCTASSRCSPKPEEAPCAARCVRRAVHGRAGAGAPRAGKIHALRPSDSAHGSRGGARACWGGVTRPAHSRPFRDSSPSSPRCASRRTARARRGERLELRRSPRRADKTDRSFRTTD